MDGYKQIAARRSVRLEQHGVLISKVLFRPGPTHSLIDLLAAVVPALGTGCRIALLGFAGGGLLAPLRAMGVGGSIEAVDISRAGYEVFERHCRAWCGPVRLHQADALAWLQDRPDAFDVILEDLSLPQNGDVVKPGLIWAALPSWVGKRLTPSGVAAFNLLRPSCSSWSTAIEQVARPFQSAVVLLLKDFENRIVLAADRPLSARLVSRRLRAPLRRIGSRMAERFEVRGVSV